MGTSLIPDFLSVEEQEGQQIVKQRQKFIQVSLKVREFLTE
jgi:hypothetical protein